MSVSEQKIAMWRARAALFKEAQKELDRLERLPTFSFIRRYKALCRAEALLHAANVVKDLK